MTQRAPRANIRLPLRMRAPGAQQVIEAFATNFSRSGMFIATEEFPALGSVLQAEVVLRDGTVLLSANIEVVRHQGGGELVGVGVFFLDLPERSIELLERLVADAGHFAHFRIEALIGKGGMAEVYRAEALRGRFKGRTVALKRLLPRLACNPLYVDLFVGEADVSRSLRHPNIVEVYETGAVGNSYYIAMEYVEGGTLAQVLQLCVKRRISMPVDLAVHVAQVVAEALEYAHGLAGPNGTPLGIVHCDVTPSNILISHDGLIKLSDFGVVHIGAFESADAKAIAGKAPYMAPEQFQGQSPSPATDVFALGAVLFEMFTLRDAFGGDSVKEIQRKIFAGDVQQPSKFRPELDSGLDRVVMKAMATASPHRHRAWWQRALPSPRALRHGSARALIDALEPYREPLAATPQVLARFLKRLRTP